MKIRFDLKYHLAEGSRSIFTHGFMSFAAVCMIVACLIIMGTFSLVALNLDNLLGDLERENEFLVYIDESLTEEEARGLETQITAIPNVASATFVTREEALGGYVENMAGDTYQDLYQDLPDSTLRHRYRIRVVDIEQFQATVERVTALPQVANYQAALEVAKGFVTVRNVATIIAVAMVAILLLVSLFIISNTIRLATFYRREELAIMKMCGATDWFIRWPFIFEGILLGLMGALIAFGLEWGVYALIQKAILETEWAGLLKLLPFNSLAPSVLGIFCSTGVVVGVGGSLLAIRRFLRV